MLAIVAPNGERPSALRRHRDQREERSALERRHHPVRTSLFFCLFWRNTHAPSGRHLTSELQQLEIKVFCSDAEKGEVLLGQHSIEVRQLVDHTANDLWVTLTPPLVSSRSAVLASSAKSPRLKGEASGALAGPKESDLHLLLYVARTSDDSAVAAKLQEKDYVNVVSLLAREPLDLALQLCALTPQALGDKMAAALVTLLHQGKMVLPFIRAIVQQEVSTTTSSSVLFRSNSMAIRVLSAYGRVVGGPYLEQVLGDLLKQVCQDDTSYEPDPQVAPETAATNAEHIAKLSARFLARILESSDAVPPAFRIVCSDLRTIVGAKFADFWPRAVGGFFFLRYLCPAIASPTTAGLVNVIPSKNARRTLILVTKVLQNVANQTAFNEPWMVKAEECVKEHIPRVEKFLEGISVVDSGVAAVAGEDRTRPDPQVLFKAVGDLKEICVGTFEVDSAVFMENLKATSRSAKPYAHSGLESKLKSLGGIVVESDGPQVFWDETKQVVLNHAICLKMLPLDSEQTAFDLAQAATLTLKSELEKEAEKGPFEDGVFIDWNAIRALPSFVAFERNLSDLHHVRPDSIPVEGRESFWINVFNSVNFHAHVVTEGKAAKAHSDWFYAVGGHLFTCDEIAYGILRGNTVKGRGARKNLFFKADDPRRNYVVALDNKVNFCLATFAWDSPVLRPYDRDPNSLRRAASVYCEKFIQNDIVKTEVVIPKLVEDNKADWAEEDVLQRVLQLVQFVTSRKLDILQTLTNPKVSITVSKAKGPAHPIYWLGQMRTDSKDALQKKETASSHAATMLKVGGPSGPTVRRLTLNRDDVASLSTVMSQAANTSPRLEVPTPSSPVSTSSANSGWQRAARAPANALSSSDVKLTKLAPSGSPKPGSPLTGSSTALRVEPRLRPDGNADILDLKTRRSPRSPRLGLRGVFAEKDASSGSPQQRSSGFQDDDQRSSAQDLSSSSSNIHVSPSKSESSPLSVSSPTIGSLPSPSPIFPSSFGSTGGSVPAIPPKPVATPSSPPRSPRNAKRATPSLPMAPVASSTVVPGSPSASPRMQTAFEAVAAATTMASVIRSHLDNVLVDSAELLEFEVAIKTGKVLMQLRKNLMSFLGWSEMPTSGVQQVPVVSLTKLQERFLPDNKQAMFVKLIQAFHSAVLDVHAVLDEMLFIAPTGSEELVRWKAREVELNAVLKDADKLLSEHREVLTASLAREDDYVQVMELSDVLKPEVANITSILAVFSDELEKGTCRSVPELCRLLAKAKTVLETGEEVSSTTEEESAANAKAMVAALLAKFSSVSDVIKSVTANSKGLLMLTSRSRQVNAMLSQWK